MGDEIERRENEQEPGGLDYVKVGLGLVFVFGGIISPPGDRPSPE